MFTATTILGRRSLPGKDPTGRQRRDLQTSEETKHAGTPILEGWVFHRGKERIIYGFLGSLDGVWYSANFGNCAEIEQRYGMVFLLLIITKLGWSASEAVCEEFSGIIKPFKHGNGKS